MKNLGFSLIELIVAMSLTGLVLAGVISVATSMLQFGSQGRLKAGVSSGALVGLDQLYREIENATYLNSSVLPGDALAGCVNYSAVLSNRIDPAQCVTAFVYCVAPNYPAAGANSLVRYSFGSCGPFTCPLAVPSPCGTGPLVPLVLVSQPVSHISGNPSYFTASPGIGATAPGNTNAVDVRMAIGNTVPTAASPQPTVFNVATTIQLNKSYQGTGD